jgi:hypothetical protein
MDIFTAPTFNTLPARSPIVARPVAAPFVTDYIDSGPGYTTVRMSDGTTQTLKGTRADRNNNPGNLTGTLAGAQRRGAIGVDHGGNYIFPSADAGRKAMAEMVLNENANKSIGDMLNMYAPPGAANDPKNTNRLYPGLIAKQGFNLQDNVGSLAPAQQQALLGAMMGVEGYSGAPAAQLASAAPVAPAASPAPPAVNPMMLRAGSQNRGPAVTSPTATPMDFAGAAQNRIANAQSQADQAANAQGTGGGGGGWGGSPMAVGAGRAETKELGLLADPQVASTVAETTANAVQKASSRSGPPKPLTKKEREKWSPESLGLIAFGLSLLGGSDMDTALSAGMNIYDSLQSRKDRKERQKNIDELIAKQDPETQEVLRLLGDDAKAIATYIGGREQRKAAEAEAQARQAQFAGDVASRDLTPQMQQRVANAKDPAGELVKIDEESRQVKGNLATMQSTHDRILSDIDAIRQMVGGEFYNDETGQIETVTGMSNDGNFFGAMDALVPAISIIPRTKAKDYAQRLDTLKANIGFGELQKMRDNSPTGGALGQVTERELGFLQSVLGAIGTDTKYETLLQTLDKAEQVYREMLSAAQTDYAKYYGAPQTNNASAARTYSFGGSSYEVQ